MKHAQPMYFSAQSNDNSPYSILSMSLFQIFRQSVGGSHDRKTPFYSIQKLSNQEITDEIPHASGLEITASENLDWSRWLNSNTPVVALQLSFKSPLMNCQTPLSYLRDWSLPLAEQVQACKRSFPA